MVCILNTLDDTTRVAENTDPILCTHLRGSCYIGNYNTFVTDNIQLQLTQILCCLKHQYLTTILFIITKHKYKYRH